MGDYEQFLSTKTPAVQRVGFDAQPSADYLFPFQCDLTRWSARLGRSAVFAQTGLGKTRLELEWSRLVCRETGGSVLILAPLSVASQTAREAALIGIPVTLCRDCADVQPGINVTNYDRLHRFDPSLFAGVALDESSIIKHHDAKTFARLTESFGRTRFKLCATATPAPNDYTELGTHAEFLGVCSRMEMLSEYFVHDASDTQTWRLKGHARAAFWRWVASWGALIRKPSDLGYEDARYDLPPLKIHQHVVAADHAAAAVEHGTLFALEARTLNERRAARRGSLSKRVALCAELIMECKCGTRNTTRAVERATQQTASIEKSESHKDESQKITSSTCEPIIKKTKSAGRSEIRKSDELRLVSDTPPMQHSERNANGTQPSTTASILASSSDNILRNTASRSSNTISSSLRKTENAPSANANETSTRIGDSTSITAIVPEESGGCSAPLVISGSANSETTPIVSSARPRTCACDANERWIVWCDYNAEQEALEELFGEQCISIYGSLDIDEKERRLDRFIRGEGRILLGKPTIFGFGINLQSVARMAFVGLSDSYEQFYQAVRRCWRFGQSRAVDVHVVIGEQERAVLDNVMRKQQEAERMAEELSAETAAVVRAEIHRTSATIKSEYVATRTAKAPAWLKGVE